MGRCCGSLANACTLRTLEQMAHQGEVRWIFEADIVSFFDSLDRTALKKMLEVRVADGALLRLIGKCLHVAHPGADGAPGRGAVDLRGRHRILLRQLGSHRVKEDARSSGCRWGAVAAHWQMLARCAPWSRWRTRARCGGSSRQTSY